MIILIQMKFLLFVLLVVMVTVVHSFDSISKYHYHIQSTVISTPFPHPIIDYLLSITSGRA